MKAQANTGLYIALLTNLKARSYRNPGKDWHVPIQPRMPIQGSGPKFQSQIRDQDLVALNCR